MTSLLLALLALLLTGCGRTVDPARPVSLGTNPPSVATDCTSAPCYCGAPTQLNAYQRATHATFPTGYQGDGARTLVVLTDSPAITHLWPAGPCGQAMAAMADSFGCPVCTTTGRVTEPEVFARTLTGWPDSSGAATYRPRTGLAYYCYQHDRPSLLVAAGEDTVTVE